MRTTVSTLRSLGVRYLSRKKDIARKAAVEELKEKAPTPSLSPPPHLETKPSPSSLSGKVRAQLEGRALQSLANELAMDSDRDFFGTLICFLFLLNNILKSQSQTHGHGHSKSHSQVVLP